METRLNRPVSSTKNSVTETILASEMIIWRPDFNRDMLARMRVDLTSVLLVAYFVITDDYNKHNFCNLFDVIISCNFIRLL